jgi:hypothetical protein
MHAGSPTISPRASPGVDVDPETQTVTVYASLLSPIVRREDDMLDGEDVIPGFNVRVGQIRHLRGRFVSSVGNRRRVVAAPNATDRCAHGFSHTDMRYIVSLIVASAGPGWREGR